MPQNAGEEENCDVGWAAAVAGGYNEQARYAKWQEIWMFHVFLVALTMNNQLMLPNVNFKRIRPADCLLFSPPPFK